MFTTYIGMSNRPLGPGLGQVIPRGRQRYNVTELQKIAYVTSSEDLEAITAKTSILGLCILFIDLSTPRDVEQTPLPMECLKPGDSTDGCT